MQEFLNCKSLCTQDSLHSAAFLLLEGIIFRKRNLISYIFNAILSLGISLLSALILLGFGFMSSNNLIFFTLILKSNNYLRNPDWTLSLNSEILAHMAGMGKGKGGTLDARGSREKHANMQHQNVSLLKCLGKAIFIATGRWRESPSCNSGA